jgi:hypothetical protein
MMTGYIGKRRLTLNFLVIPAQIVTDTNGNGRFELGCTIMCNRSQSDLSITPSSL